MEPHAAPEPVGIPAAKDLLEGSLVVPRGARGIVLFAHGSGSSRASPRNQAVARDLEREGLATLLFDLLTPAEAEVDYTTGHLRFDVELLAERLVRATDWVLARPDLARLRIGYFGASTGAAAALIGAAMKPDRVAAVVARGGRPDLAGRALPSVRCPTLLIVGGHDLMVLELNRDAFIRLRTIKRLEIVPGASHLFEEPGTLERASGLACDWFARYLG